MTSGLQLGLGPGFEPVGDARRELSQWDTRPDTARCLVEWAGVRERDLVLEPSAGKGNIVEALLEAGALVWAIEIDPARVAFLRERFRDAIARGLLVVYAGDFLDHAAQLADGSLRFDKVVGNPPYEGDADLNHTLAMLRIAPAACLLLRLAFLAGQERRRLLWRHNRLARLKVLSAREEFEGDVVGTPKSDFAFFEIRRGLDGASAVEWL